MERLSVLLERERELAALRDAVQMCATGRSRLVWIEGDAGIGKTRLLEAAADASLGASLDVFTARSAAIEQDHAFGVVRQLFETRLARLPASKRKSAFAGAAGLADPLLGGPAAAPGTIASGHAMHDALYRLVTNLAERRPVALLVDDVHWADEPSLRWLGHLVRRLDDTRVLLVAAARPAQARASDDGLVDVVAGEAHVVIRPRPLTPTATAAVLEAAVGQVPAEQLVSACSEATGGNPYLIGELAGALAEDALPAGDATVERVRELGPASVARYVLARVTQLGPDAARLARALAVLGREAQLPTAARVAGLDGGAAADAADALAAADVLEPGRPLVFIHPIVQRAVYSDLSASKRVALHRDAAHALAAEGAAAGEVAPHLLATDPAGDAWTVEQLQQAAADAIANGAPETAVRLLRRALAEPPPAETRAWVLAALGRAEARAPNATGAAVHLREAIALAGDPNVELGLSLELSETLFLAGKIDESAELLTRILDSLSDDQRELGLAVQAALLTCSYASPAIRQTIERTPWRFRGNEDVPQTPGDRVWLAIRAFQSAPTSGAERDQAVALTERALAGGLLLAEQTSDSPAFYLAANTLIVLDALDIALPIFDAAVADAHRRGSVRGLAMASAWRAAAAYRHGDIAAAIGDATTALEAIEHGGRLAIGLPLAGAFLCDALRESGDLDGAARAVARGLEPGEQAGAILFDFLLQAEGRLLLDRGRPAEALARFEEVGRRESQWAIAGPSLVEWRSAAAVANAALGRRAPAAELANEEIAIARQGGSNRALGVALRAAGLVAGGEEGMSLLREAEALLATSSARLEHARTLVDLGAAVRHSGARAAAREPLRAGLDLARAIGAKALAARAHDELAATGVTQRKILGSGVEELTPSERRVAELAADGLTNREIAATLFVTVRTVEAHLGHAYRKLGVRRRSALAQALRCDMAGASQGPPPGEPVPSARRSVSRR